MAKFKLDTGNFDSVFQNAVAAQVAASFKAVRSASRESAQSGQTLAMQLATQKLRSQAQKYISGLQFSFPDDGDLIMNVTLDPSVAYLETGYPRFDMKPGILKNAKRVSKDGNKYQPVPFSHAGTSIPAEQSRTVQIGQTMQTTRGSMLADLAQLKSTFSVPDMSKVPGTDKNAQGKVWSIAKSPTGPQWTMIDNLTGKRSPTRTIADVHPNLGGITKIQYKAGTTMRSAYITWRTATEGPAGASKFIHPGFGGVKILQEVEKHIIQTLNTKMSEIFKG